MIIAITGHLQYVACMQLSQLENASLMSDNCPWASEITPLCSSPACKLRATMSSTPPLTLLAIATSIEGISASAHPKLFRECPNAQVRRTKSPRARVAIALPEKNAGLAVPLSKLHGWVSPRRFRSSNVSTRNKIPECSPQIQPNGVGSIKRSDDQRLGRSVTTPL